ncbi:hypothetical protein [Pontibaca methylaminivorans]|uniref:HdeA/HdeB family protein n=1 Tax=Pontibaca methylaminivorans TaxID=515897 RepID=A0A1R3WKF7_9RHOB|nr:hypothetical protein [Pontibaca methylaminivorans]SIT77083.1 hypothetical protein SAMN05421849_0662 [Pontibaca methylaminivorans]
MIRIAAALAAVLFATPLAARDVPDDCTYQARVVAALQQARLAGTSEPDAPQAVLGAGRAWPENYDAAIPLVAPWVYEQPLKALKREDLSKLWLDACRAG